MLGRMIAGGRPAYAEATPPLPLPPADYIVTTDAEWDAVFANSAAALVGKIVEVAAPASAFTQRQIANKDIDAAGGRLTIRSANAGSALPSLILNNTVRGIDFSGLNFQMTGWPKTWGANVVFNNGTFGKLRFLNGTSFRHGYGAGQADFDTTANYPEYERVSNVQTATTTSATYPLTWKDPAFNRATCWIEFFNRGANSVRVAVGGPSVVATGSSLLVAAGGYARIQSLNPTTATHFAILATAGTSEVNARTEIGLTEYLASAFSASGAAVIEDIVLRNCRLRDLSSAVKGFNPSSFVAMDCDIDRIYQDIFSLSVQPGGAAYFLRNLECLPFARSGIAENLTGDAHDPHGDQFQQFGGGTAAIGPVYYAGNRIRVRPMRTGVGSQGIFMSDNDFTPSYNGVYAISTMQVGGAPNGIVIGESGFPARNVMVYGASVVKANDPSSTAQNVTIQTDSSRTCYVGSTIAPAIAFAGTGALGVEENNLRTAPGGAAAIFPNIANLATAETRAQIEAAMATAGAGAGKGAVATSNAVDWNTSDHTAVIRWENIPSGAAWDNPPEVAASTLVTMDLRKILNRRPSQAVSVNAGTEWRSVGTDGVTEVQAWTSSPGTIAPDQFIQFRATSSPTSGGEVTAAITINGFTETVTISTEAAPSAYLIRPATAAWFQAPAGPPSGTTRITFRGKFRLPSLSGNPTLFNSESTSMALFINSATGTIRITVEDSVGTQVILNNDIVPAGVFQANTWHEVIFDANHATQQATVTVDGVTYTANFTTPGNGSFATVREMTFLAVYGTGAQNVPAGTYAADMSVDYNGTLFKAIPNDAASANADAWKAGTGVFTNG